MSIVDNLHESSAVRKVAAELLHVVEKFCDVCEDVGKKTGPAEIDYSSINNPRISANSQIYFQEEFCF